MTTNQKNARVVDTYGNEHTVEVDRDLADLITEMNRVGLITTDCCIGHGSECAYISIAMDRIRDVVQTNHEVYGRRLVIYWDPRKPLRWNRHRVTHSENGCLPQNFWGPMNTVEGVDLRS